MGMLVKLVVTKYLNSNEIVGIICYNFTVNKVDSGYFSLNEIVLKIHSHNYIWLCSWTKHK